MSKVNKDIVNDKDMNFDPNQDLSLLDKEVKEVKHDIKKMTTSSKLKTSRCTSQSRLLYLLLFL